MATTQGTDDEFNTGVECVVASEPSCHCQFSTISLFSEEKKNEVDYSMQDSPLPQKAREPYPESKVIFQFLQTKEN